MNGLSLRSLPSFPSVANEHKQNGRLALRCYSNSSFQPVAFVRKRSDCSRKYVNGPEVRSREILKCYGDFPLFFFICYSKLTNSFAFTLTDVEEAIARNQERPLARYRYRASPGRAHLPFLVRDLRVGIKQTIQALVQTQVLPSLSRKPSIQRPVSEPAGRLGPEAAVSLRGRIPSPVTVAIDPDRRLHKLGARSDRVLKPPTLHYSSMRIRKPAAGRRKQTKKHLPRSKSTRRAPVILIRRK